MSKALPFFRRMIWIGGTHWQVDSVEDQDALLCAAETSAQFPFGLILWESAVALSQDLYARAPNLAGKTILELGAGLGLSGVVAASLGATVTQTDHDATALRACAHTAAINVISGITRTLGDWHAWQDATQYDFVLGADIAYDADDHNALFAVFKQCVKPDGLVLLADPRRQNQTAFLGHAAIEGWAVSSTVCNSPDLRSVNAALTVPIDVFQLRRC